MAVAQVLDSFSGKICALRRPDPGRRGWAVKWCTTSRSGLRPSTTIFSSSCPGSDRCPDSSPWVVRAQWKGQVGEMLVDMTITKTHKVRYDLVPYSRRWAHSCDGSKTKTARLCMRLEGSIGPSATVTASGIPCPPEPEYDADITV